MSEDERDREWLRVWCEGDDRGGDRLTKTYFGPVRRYFHRRAPDEYEDLVQRTFLEFSGSKASYRGEGTVRSFLFAIAHKVHLKYLKSLSRQRAVDPFQSSLYEIYRRRPSSLLAAREELQVLLDVLQEIPVAMQDMLEFYYWETLSGPELSVIFDISESAIHGHLFRARKLLRRKLQERGVAHLDEQLEPMLEQARGLQR